MADILHYSFPFSSSGRLTQNVWPERNRKDNPSVNYLNLIPS